MQSTDLKSPYGHITQKESDRIDNRVKADRAALEAKLERHPPWRIGKAAREERWSIQTELRAALRFLTGKKWLVVPKRSLRDPDFTVTFRAHWIRLPTVEDRQRLVSLLGKEWCGDSIALTLTEARAFLSAHSPGVK